jgi:Kef-type K+ transport system membrane component KefB
MSFGILALVVAAGLVGPLLASVNASAPPAVVGEIVAGVAIGQSGFHWLKTDNPSVRTLATIGFALLMFVVGTHLPIRNKSVLSALKKSVLVALTAAVVAVVTGMLVARLIGFHKPLVIAVLVATSSAAVALPILEDVAGESSDRLVTLGWIAIADIASVLAIPLVMATGNLFKVIGGSALVVAVAICLFFLVRRTRERKLVRQLRDMSRERGWALDLRVSLVVLFALAWIATSFGTSILIAGFAGGTLVAVLGEPRRVAQQLIGVAEGFFVPFFFVDLGARLDVREFIKDGHAVWLATALLCGALFVHFVSAKLWKLSVNSALIATAALGVPSAIASVGLSSGLLTGAQASAVMVSVLGSLGACAVGASRLGRASGMSDHAAPK